MFLGVPACPKPVEEGGLSFQSFFVAFRLRSKVTKKDINTESNAKSNKLYNFQYIGH
ncbi:MAG: hypothetical protein JWQ25_2771 [Daejeonella sp.]|nr:hypothetical protein [Daejeonella sp.]